MPVTVRVLGKPLIDGPVFEESYEVIRHDQREGWLFLHAGQVLLAVKAVNGLTFDGVRGEGRVLKSEGRRNGLVVETASVTEYPGQRPEEELHSFADRILLNTDLEASSMNTDQPVVRYTTLSGDTLSLKFDGYKRVNGDNLDVADWPLLGNPWMHQNVGASPMHRAIPTSEDAWKRHDTGAATLRLEHEGRRRVYNFESWTVDHGSDG